MLTKIYLVLGILMIVLYAYGTMTGKEIGDPEREMIPADVRQSPGGYRSFHFWHGGYRGGK